MNTVCIYHGNCWDGLGAAWAFNRALSLDTIDGATPEKTLYVPASYGDVPPTLTKSNVYILDFSYPRDILIEMAEQANHITVIDHHATAERNLVDLPDNVTTVFDKSHSGTVLAWKHFMPTAAPVPQILLHIEDRDLWKFNLPDTRPLTEVLRSEPLAFKTLDKFYPIPQYKLQSSINLGYDLIRVRDKQIADLIDSSMRHTVFRGYGVPILNCPPHLTSDTGNTLLARDTDIPFVILYHDGKDHRHYSLRSTDTGVDVSKIAENYGGGGHHNASGFTQPLQDTLMYPSYNLHR